MWVASRASSASEETLGNPGLAVVRAHQPASTVDDQQPPASGQLFMIRTRALEVAG